MQIKVYLLFVSQFCVDIVDIKQALFSLAVLRGCHGACTYADLNLELYNCFDSRSVTTEYVLPVMSNTFLATLFCSSHLSGIKTCVETAIGNCSSNSNVTKFFGDGSYLSSAYTYICNQFDSTGSEPFTCATTIDMAAVKSNLSAFDAAVDALASPTTTEICNLANDLGTALMTEVSVHCVGSQTSVDIWQNFLSKFSKECNSGAEGGPGIGLMLVVVSLIVSWFQFESSF